MVCECRVTNFFFVSVTICEDGEYKCPYSPHCIPVDYVCDGLPDCFFGEDEQNCTGIDKAEKLTSNLLYLHNFWIGLLYE